MNETIPAAFAAAVHADPTTPLLTWYDDTTGDRTELSGATMDNWVAKTANLLVDGAGLGPGDAAAVLLPPHWQTAAILLGTWTAGPAVHLGPGPRPVDVVFAGPATAEAAGAWPAGDRYATGLLPLAMPMRPLPAGFADYTIEVRGHGDRFTAYQPVTPDDPALGATSHREISAAATARARELGITPGARVLIDAAARPDPLDWLLAPLYAGASIVLCASLDPAVAERRAAAEHVTLTL
ncbi:TIGR03089 family protein [Couchioplanes azureus]|uniref:TIGR03089 family protein n=1 Tax=Couchioplanes caeruleus TaxID=56438 RepID=UPI001670BE15|nr:TIGR03089 family protein [Couchioplanes caeruleus]GGQ65061.1 acyl-CoA synthetase [Couchioplanes caeruleus subsp. azureus]